MPCSDFIALSVGNSSLAWSTVGAGEPAPPARSPVDEPAPPALREAAARLPVFAASVNPPRLERLREELGGPIAVLGRDVPIPIANDTRRPDEVGTDRLLAALGAFLRHGPAIVVDAGTAITVNLVTEGPTFRGGAILPGPRLWAQALRSGTALLPDASGADAGAAAYGRDTREAIACGMRWGIAGAVERLIEKLGEVRPGCAVCLTGGGAPFLRPHLAATVIAEDDLVFAGIAAAVRRGA
jgi:type III pantothenate kinase